MLRLNPVSRLFTQPLLACRGLATAATPSVRSFKLSAEEKASGRLNKVNLQAALEALHHDGILCLEDVIPHDALDRLNKHMVADVKRLQDMGEKGPFNYEKSNYQIDPELAPHTYHPSIFLNPLAAHVSSAFLGGRPQMSFISGNAAVQLEGAKGQPVHADSDWDHPKIPFACVVNVGLIDMTPENGSTELWLGTHSDAGLHQQEGAHGDRASGRIKQELLDERRKISPPFQPVVPKGSLLVRDLRLWHSGKPNLTPDPRVMLAFIHFAPWFRCQMQVPLLNDMREVMEAAAERQGLDLVAEWKETVDHLEVKYGNAYNFSQTPTTA
ncbi:hypothetical protein JCM10207_003453 [Rhodosporidiobolus poonsookiae]